MLRFPHKNISSEDEKNKSRKKLKVNFMQRDLPFRKKKMLLHYALRYT